MSKRRPSVFIWATGQLDNIGDSLLRRPYIATLSTLGEPCVWVKDADQAFLTGMGLSEQSNIEHDYGQWYRRAFKAALRGKATVAVNAGEVPVSRKGALRLASIALLASLARSRGGTLVWLGAGVPPSSSKLLAMPYKLTSRLAQHVWVRDPDSNAMLPGSQLVPDWAFDLGDPVDDWTEEGRSVLAVTLRGDRPLPSDEWFTWLQQQAESNSLTLTFLAQVKSDNSRAEELAERFQAEALLFPDVDHSVQEDTVRALYRRSAYIVGDRLHGLIVGATEGAVPVGWVPTSKGKIRRHFNGADMPWVGEFEGSAPSSLPQLTSLPDHAGLKLSVAAARRRIDTARASLASRDR